MKTAQKKQNLKRVKTVFLQFDYKTLRVYENTPPFIPYFLNKDAK